MDTEIGTNESKTISNRPLFGAIREYFASEVNRTRYAGDESTKLFLEAYAEVGKLKSVVTAIAAIEKRVMDMKMEKYERDELEYYFGLIK